MKARLRAWLIGIVREAIRVERYAEQHPLTPNTLAAIEQIKSRAINSSIPPISLEPSFEQMQADSIAAQEKFYEPRRV